MNKDEIMRRVNIAISKCLEKDFYKTKDYVNDFIEKLDKNIYNI